MGGRALVVVHHGLPLAVCWDGDEGVRQYLDDVVGHPDTFPFGAAGVDYDELTDGLWIGELRIADNGPGDWPGSRECILKFCKERYATPDEWQAHLSGEWPWETLPNSEGTEKT